MGGGGDNNNNNNNIQAEIDTIYFSVYKDGGRPFSYYHSYAALLISQSAESYAMEALLKSGEKKYSRTYLELYYDRMNSLNHLYHLKIPSFSFTRVVGVIDDE
jgi:hypothetical protein